MSTLEHHFMAAQLTKTNHILHLLLSIVTCGFWIIIWLCVASHNASKRRQLTHGESKADKVIHFIGKLLIGGLLASLVLSSIVIGLVIALR